jgi:hypothetical protein
MLLPIRHDDGDAQQAAAALQANNNLRSAASQLLAVLRPKMKSTTSA